MARIIDLPAELLLAIVSQVPLYVPDLTENVLDNGLNLTCKLLSHIWKTEFWNSVSVSTLSQNDAKHCKCPRHDVCSGVNNRNTGNQLTRMLKFTLGRFLQNPSLVLNLRYTQQLHLCLYQRSRSKFTMNNINLLADVQDKFVGGLRRINVWIGRSFFSQYGNYIVKFMREQHPNAHLRLVLVQHKSAWPSGCGARSFGRDPTPTSMATRTAEIDADEFCLIGGGQKLHYGGVPGIVPNADFVSNFHCRCSRLSLMTLTHITFDTSIKIPDSVRCLKILQYNVRPINEYLGVSEIIVKTKASDISITRHCGEQSRKLVLQAPEVHCLTMDMAIYNKPGESLQHSLPTLGRYQLHLTDALESSPHAGTGYNRRDQDILPWANDLKQAIAHSTTLQHYLPTAIAAALWDRYRRIHFGHGWVMYLLDMFVIKATDKLQHLEFIPPIEASKLQYFINDSAMGPLLGEIIAHQRSLTSIKMNLYVKDEDEARHVFGESPVSQVLQQGDIVDEQSCHSGTCVISAWIKMDEYTRLYNVALSKGTVVQRLFGYPVRLTGVNIAE